MCLHSVENLNEEALRNLKNGTGWKSIHIDEDGDADLHDGYYPVNKWIKANSDKTITSSAHLVGYKAGFHIFLNKQDAIDYSDGKITRVKFSDVTAIGKQESYNQSATVIAKKMFICVPQRKKKGKKKNVSR